MAERFQLRAGALDWIDRDGEIVVLDSDRSIYLSLNGTGAVLWRAIVNPASEDHLVRSLVQEFEVGEERARADVTRFLRRLDDLGLIGRSD